MTLDLYIHSFDVVYNTDIQQEINKFPVIFPDTVTVLANSILNIDMKLRVNLFCPLQGRFPAGPIVVPDESIINTPLIYLLPGMPIGDGKYASDLYIPVRNLSNTNYVITSGTSLFNIINGTNYPMIVKQVSDDHLTMELKSVE